jgi:HD-like signal output (HDOD) protein
MYAPIGREVATVSQALMVLGYEAVGYLALGVRLISSLDASDTPAAAEKVLGRSMLAGSIATAVVAGAGIPNGEEGVVCSLLHRLGQLLVAFYLPDEWQRIQQAVTAGQDEDAAAQAELGLDLGELGRLVARKWRMPAKIVATMDTRPDQQTGDADEHLLAITRFSNQAARIMSTGDEQAAPARLAELAASYGKVLAVDQAALLGAVAVAVDGATSEPLLANLLRTPERREPAPAEEVLPSLARGLRDVERAIAAGSAPRDIMAMVAEVMFTGPDLQRAAVFMHDPAQGQYQVRVSLSARAANHLQGFAFSDAFTPNVVHVVLGRGADVYIDNPRDTKIAHRLPDWIAHHGLHPFFILPMVRDGKGIGFLYGQQKGDITLDEEVLAQLKQLRDLLAAVAE